MVAHNNSDNEVQADRQEDKRSAYRETLALRWISEGNTEQADTFVRQCLQTAVPPLGICLLHYVLAPEKERAARWQWLTDIWSNHSAESASCLPETRGLFARAASEHMGQMAMEGSQKSLDMFRALIHENERFAMDMPTPYVSAGYFSNNAGRPLMGIPHDQWSRAAIRYSQAMEVMDLSTASSVLRDLDLSIRIESLANLYRETFLKCQSFYFPGSAKVTIEDIVVSLYADFSKESKSIVRERMQDGPHGCYARLWRETVSDEDGVTEEQLGAFYGALPFPVGGWSPANLNSLDLAYRAIPTYMIAARPHVKAVFDWGGNTGDTLAVVRDHCEVDTCTLVEENEGFIRYARFRDAKLKANGMTYFAESTVLARIEDYVGRYDFGICTEVLEHVYRVEDTVAAIAALLRPGGLLFFSASFGYYPFPSHLKKNREYAGHEDALLARYGLRRLDLKATDTPLPLLSNMAIYEKG